MLSNLLEQHPYFTILSPIGFVGMCLLYRYSRTIAILKYPNRNVWDLALFPGISKLFWLEERSIVIPMGLLIFVPVLALITSKSELRDLFKVNLGLVIGICVRWAEHKIQQKKESGNQDVRKIVAPNAKSYPKIFEISSPHPSPLPRIGERAG